MCSTLVVHPQKLVHPCALDRLTVICLYVNVKSSGRIRLRNICARLCQDQTNAAEFDMILITQSVL